MICGQRAPANREQSTTEHLEEFGPKRVGFVRGDLASVSVAVRAFEVGSEIGRKSHKATAYRVDRRHSGGRRPSVVDIRGLAVPAQTPRHRLCAFFDEHLDLAALLFLVFLRRLQ